MALFHNAAYSLRFLAKRPGFTFAAVLTIALGIGANTAVFSTIHAVLIRPLPFPAQDRLVVVSENDRARGVNYFSCSQRMFRAIARRRDVFSSVTAGYSRIANLDLGNDRLTVRSEQTDTGFLPTLGIKPLYGRGFHSDETRAGAPAPVIVLGNELWRRRFGADPKVIGRTLRIDDVPSTVIGVMPPAERWLEADVLVPFQPVVTAFESRRMLTVIGRLKTGLTPEKAAAMLRKTADAVSKEWPETHGGWTVTLRPFTDVIVGASTRRLLYLLGGAVILILLIACANLINLLLARAVGRRRELAIHAALGAGRFSLARRFMTESLIVALAGGAAGLLLALWVVDLFRYFGSGQIVRIDAATIGWQALGFAAALTLATGLATGFVPVLHAAGAEPNRALQETGNGDGRGPQRSRSVLVVVEVALALALLTGAGLLGRSILRASRVDPGLEVENRYAITVNLPPQRYSSGNAVVEFWRTLLDRIRSIPGVTGAAATSDRWLLAGRRIVQYDVKEAVVNRRVPVAELRTVTPGYFRTLGIPLIRGRVFTETDRGPVDAGPVENRHFVVVVSRTLAAKQWPGENPIGKLIRPVVGNRESYWSTVIGVVDDIRQSALTESPVPTVYLPEYQYAWLRLFLLVHVSGDPVRILPKVSKAIAGLDSTLPANDVVPLSALKSDALSLGRFLSFLFAAFAAIALTLAVVGVYGLMAWSVACRRREFGVRIALGADRRKILLLVLGRGVKLTLLGAAIGIMPALALGLSLQTMLFETSATDPVTLAAVAGLLLLVAAAACLIPGWRAASVNAADALRNE